MSTPSCTAAPPHLRSPMLTLEIPSTSVTAFLDTDHSVPQANMSLYRNRYHPRLSGKVRIPRDSRGRRLRGQSFPTIPHCTVQLVCILKPSYYQHHLLLGTHKNSQDCINTGIRSPTSSCTTTGAAMTLSLLSLCAEASGVRIGVALDEPLADSDGAHPSKQPISSAVQLFECTGPRYGIFAHPNDVVCGDYPPVDPFSLDEI
eukprot:Lankesteria_metandrocarpae@DN5348_c1_g1_i7.p1